MGEYAPPAEDLDTSPPACVRTGDVSALVDADVPVAYGQTLGTDVCLDVDLNDPSVDADADVELDDGIGSYDQRRELT